MITATNATAGTTDRLNIQYDTRNGIRIQQQYNAVDDVRCNLIQKVANVDKTTSSKRKKISWLLGKMSESGFPDASGREEG